MKYIALTLAALLAVATVAQAAEKPVDAKVTPAADVKADKKADEAAKN